MRRSPTDTDPRTYLGDEALLDANRLAMPKVGGKSDAPHYVIGVALAIGLGAMTFAQMNAARLKRATPPAPAPVAQAPIGEPPPAPLPAYAPPAPPPYVAEPEPEPLRPDRLRAPGLVVDFSETGPHAPPPALGVGASGASVTASDLFAARTRNAEEAPATATDIENVSSVILEGTIIAGVLETALNSDLPGYARAIVSEDVRSFDGAHVLAPRGSRLIGQYRSGLAVGESRAFVIWTRLVLPDGESIRIGSPATDTLGRAGLAGSVDRHFVQRFGSAILLSVIGAGLNYATAQGAGNNAVVVGTTSDAFAVAQQALQANQNIPPTVKIPQGAPVRIFVARDLYFPDRARAALAAAEPRP